MWGDERGQEKGKSHKSSSRSHRGSSGSPRAKSSQSDFGKLILDAFKAKLTERHSINGINTLAVVFRNFDENRDRKISRDEFKYGLQDIGLKLEKMDLEILMQVLDGNRDGVIDFDEFLVAIRGNLNERRKDLIAMAFQRLDKDGDGAATFDELCEVYDTSHHPQVKSGKMTNAQCLKQFISQWDTRDHDGIITYEEFLDYYKNVSASIEKDDYFELMIRNAWHISGGTGWCENTTCLRCLVTKYDGTQEVVELKDDLGVDPRNYKLLKVLLQKQGVRDISRIQKLM